MNNMYTQANIGANNGSKKLFAPTFISTLFSSTCNTDRTVLVKVQRKVKRALQSAMKALRPSWYASTLSLRDGCWMPRPGRFIARNDPVPIVLAVGWAWCELYGYSIQISRAVPKWLINYFTLWGTTSRFQIVKLFYIEEEGNPEKVSYSVDGISTHTSDAYTRCLKWRFSEFISLSL
jgi:hypothetical protein